jgi:hypothetical protein
VKPLVSQIARGPDVMLALVVSIKNIRGKHFASPAMLGLINHSKMPQFVMLAPKGSFRTLLENKRVNCVQLGFLKVRIHHQYVFLVYQDSIQNNLDQPFASNV